VKDYTIAEKVELVQELVNEIESQVNGSVPENLKGLGLNPEHSILFRKASHTMLGHFLQWFKDGTTIGLTCTFSEHLKREGL